MKNSLSVLAFLSAFLLQAPAAEVERQFAETAYYLRAVHFVDANTGWAVGDPHWNQTRQQMEGTILRTDDGGAQWMEQAASHVASFQGVHFIDKERGWVVGDGGAILTTTNGGALWTARRQPGGNNFQSVVFVDAHNGWITGTRPVHYRDFTGDFDDWKASVWRTSDGGRSWAEQALPPTASLLFDIDFTDAQNGWAAGARLFEYGPFGPEHVGAVYHTADGGETWTEQYLTGEGFTFTSIDFTDHANGWSGGFSHSSGYQGEFVFRTGDGGATWQGQDGPGGVFDQIRDVAFADENRGYAVGTCYLGDGACVWRTLDGGAVWDNIRMDKTNPLRVQGLWGVSVAGGRAVAVGDRSFQATAADAWAGCGTRQTCGTGCECVFEQSNIHPNLILHEVFFAGEDKGWAVGSRTYAPNLWGQVILATVDGGLNWQPQYEHAPDPERLFSVHRLESVYFTDERNGWAVGTSTGREEAGGNGATYKERSSIVHTPDGGLTWEEQGEELCEQRACEFSVVQFLDNQKGWALSTKAVPSGGNITLARTRDGGENWEWVDTGVDGTIAVGFALVQGAMHFADEQNGWVGGWDTVIRTQDGGATWAVANVECGSPLCYLDSNALTFSGGQTGWIAGQQLYRSADGGALWSTNGPEIGGHYQDIQFTDAQTGWLSGDGGALLATTDGGGAWTPLATGTGGALLGLHFPNRLNGWIVGDFGTILKYSEDPNPSGLPEVASVTNGASFLPGTASGAWTTVFGSNLSPTTRMWNGGDFVGGALPTSLDGVSVRINGKSAYPYFISPFQINALAADDTAEGEVAVEVVTPAGRSETTMARKQAYSPGLFTHSARGGLYIVAHAPDGVWIGGYMLANDLGLSGSMREARPGDVLTFYGTGFGGTSPPSPTGRLLDGPAELAAPVAVHFGRTEADVLWAGIISPGVYQFNIQVPEAGFGDNVVVVEIGGQRSQPAVIPVAR